MSDQKQVFLVREGQGGVVSASLTLDGAVAELNRQAVDDLRILNNSRHYQLRAVKLVTDNDTASAEVSEGLTKEQAESVSSLMRNNAEMFDSTIKVLGRQTVSLLQENAALQQQIKTLTAALQAKESAQT